MLALATLEPLASGETSAALAALRDLGAAAMRQGDDSLAVSCWHVVRRLAPSDPWPGHNHATCLMRSGRLGEAERLYDEQLQSFPDFMPSWRGRAQLAARQGRHDLALAHFTKALALAPRHFETLLDCARQCLALARFDDARGHLCEAASISPGEPHLAAVAKDILQRGEAAMRAGRHEEAHEILTAAPDDPGISYALASCLVALGRPDEAEPLLTALIERNPAHADACAALARLAAKRERAGDAVRLFLRAAALKPADPWLRNELGHFAVDRGELALAEAQFGIVLRRWPGFFHALRGLARVAKARGDLLAALAAFERASAAEPADPWMVYEIAALEASLGRECAGERLRRLMAQRPDFAPAYQALARLAGDAAESLRLLEAAAALRPDDHWLGFEIARARRVLGDHADAEARLRKLAEGGPTSAAARQELYHLLRERGDDAEAARLLRENLAAAPDDPGVLIAEAGRLAAEGRLDKADALYDDLARRELAPYWRRIGKGALARQRGVAAEARRWFEEAIEIDNRESAAYAELCALVATPDEAAAMLRRLDGWIAAAPRLFAARAQKARFVSQRGDPQAALAEWSSIVEIWPEKPEVHVEIAREQERLGDAAAALRSLAKAAALDPHNPALLEAQARQAEWRDDIEAARGLMVRALQIAPARRWLRPQLARLHFMTGRADEAFAALAAYPADPELEFQRIDILRQTGRLAEAAAASDHARARFAGHFRLAWQGSCLDADLGLIEKATRAIADMRPVNRFETSSVAFLAGYAAMAQWDFAAARTHLEAAIRDNPEDGWALNRLIHCHLMLFEIDAARAGLQRLARLNRSLNQIKGKSTAWSQTHYGQLLDEFRLDAQALAAVSDALKIDDADARLAALRHCVRRFPHYTPAAIAALVACRRAGLLTPSHAPVASSISPILAQFWDAANPPADLAPYLESWRAQDPCLAYRRFDAASAQAELTRLGSNSALQAFRRAEQPAMRADIFRLSYLHAHGGAYADADDRCQTSLAPLFASGASLVLYQEDFGSIGNNFLMARPGHPVIASALADATSAIEAGAADLLWLATGPGALTRALASFLFADEADWRARLADVRILDRPEMLGFIAIHCHSSYKTTERHWSRTAFGRPTLRSAYAPTARQKAPHPSPLPSN